MGMFCREQTLFGEHQKNKTCVKKVTDKVLALVAEDDKLNGLNLKDFISLQFLEGLGV